MALINWSFITSSEWDIDHPACLINLLDNSQDVLVPLQKTYIEYRIRMAPTLIIFKNGVKEKVFKAGLDLLLPTDLPEIQQTIDRINTADKF